LKRRVGSAWLVRSPEGIWEPKKGRPRGDYLDKRAAELIAAEIVANLEPDLTDTERRERRVRARAVKNIERREREAARWTTVTTIHAAGDDQLAQRSDGTEPT
jgi:pyruvate dehydrogenase complex dehydrogenase (E1) component